MALGDFEVLSFDCYGTLIDWERGIMEALAPLLGRVRPELSRADVLAAFARVEPEVEAADPSALYPDILAEVYRRLATAWGIAATAWGIAATDREAVAFGASVGDWPAFADSPAALAYLKQHFRLVVLSNVDRASFKRSNRCLGVEFDGVHTAQDIGGYKPDPRNFHYLLSRVAEMGVAPGRLLHVAQSLYHDHVPAKALGLATCWIDRGGKAGGGGAARAPGAPVTPDFRFATLGEMAAAHRAAG